MAFKDVILNTASPYLSPTDRAVVADDVILFLNDSNYDFTIIIKNADTVFHPSSKTLVYDVPAGGVVRTPPVKDAAELPLVYEVYIYINDDIIPSNAPPRIIRVN
jgi:hypothetical protein